MGVRGRVRLFPVSLYICRIFSYISESEDSSSNNTRNMIRKEREIEGGGYSYYVGPPLTLSTVKEIIKQKRHSRLLNAHIPGI